MDTVLYSPIFQIAEIPITAWLEVPMFLCLTRPSFAEELPGPCPVTLHGCFRLDDVESQGDGR